ncbi:hypothetical protein CBR_g34640 [Chara braunii]|uniref:Core Histone H2A/H2B/H3 domain-containing protein n=1 Tax=Chara braunii TaxID=69332 RepID=A0A388LJ60_CHABU|nr:hypothetical protein CBR_g34640 [Chara braunii]|eukprot:GBG82356.1 hypothetical protein CBR_g34640 [Chara braunii]
MEPAIASTVNGGETCATETEDILKDFADGSKEGDSAGGNNAAYAEVLATICAQTVEMMGDGDETENDAGGSTYETETVGEEREGGGMGSRESLTGCIVKDENVVKTSAGEEYPYDINWVSGRVQPGIVGGIPCFAFKVEGTWVPFPAPKMNTWRNVTLSIMFDRILRLNDGATAEVKGRYALDMWRVLEAQAQEHGDGQNRYMARIRRRYGCTTVLGWVPVVCPMTYEHGGDVTMRFRDPLGVPFHLTYSDGLLRDIRYLSENDLAGSAQPGKRTEKRLEISHLSAEVEGPCGPGRVGGCSAAQGDMVGPSDVAMSQSPGKMKKCTSGPPRGQTPAGRKKVNLKAVPATGDTAGARTQVLRRRRRPGMATLSEIRKLQRSTDLCLTFSPFLRLVREVVEQDIAPGMGVRFQMTAVRALLEAAKAYLVANFENTNEVAIHSKRVTIQVKDMRLVDRLSKPRWVEKYQGMLDEKARAEERQERMEARQAERDGSRAEAKKRKAVPRKGGSAKKKAA